MVNRIEERSPVMYARLTGFSLLLMFVLAMFANFFVLEGLIITDDPAVTARNILDNELLFRSGLVAFIFVLVLDVLIAWALFVLLKQVNRNLAILAACFRLIYTAIFAAALYNFLSVLQLLGDDSLAVLGTEQVQAHMMLFLQAFNYGWLIGLLFFSFHLLLIGYLVFKSGFMPRVIGVLLIIAFGGYLIDGLAQILLSNYADYATLFLLIVAVPGAIGELSLAIWLLVKAHKIPVTDSWKDEKKDAM